MLDVCVKYNLIQKLISVFTETDTHQVDCSAWTTKAVDIRVMDGVAIR